MNAGSSSRRYRAVCRQCRKSRTATRSDYRPICPICTARDYACRRYRLHRARLLLIAKKYRIRNRSKVLAKLRAYRRIHRKRLNRQRREWGRRNPGYNQIYYRANVKEYADRRKRWRATNRQRWLMLKRENERVRNARKAGCRAERVDYDAIWRRDRGVCGICRKKVRRCADAHFDHIIPLARKGPHVAANIQVAHARCNMRKGWRQVA